MPTVAGIKSNNSAAPVSDNIGVLPSVANAAAPLLTEGQQTLLSVDLAGGLRTSNDLLALRIVELDSIQQALQTLNSILISESHTSQAMGIEFR